jgi:hypothetical protein
VRICADLQSRPALEVLDEGSMPVVRTAGAALYEAVRAIVPHELAIERLLAAANGAVHQCADRARAISEPAGRSLISAEAFATNLVDMTTGALLAPTATASSAPGPRTR